MNLPRMLPWLAISLLLAAGVFDLAPQQLPVTLYKLSLISVAAYVGYWIDRGLFPYARPHTFIPSEDDEPFEDDSGELIKIANFGWSYEAAMIRRAIIVAACILGVSLGA